jgi:hypothetical protein
VVSPHAAPLKRYFLLQRKIASGGINCVTQQELNELHTGPEFHLSNRYASLLSMAFVALMYGAGMPILYAVAAFGFTLSYAVDKFLFINFYKRPPQYNERIGRHATSLLPWAVVLHLAVAIWMFANKAIFSSINGVDDGATTSSSGASVYAALYAYDPLNINDKLAQGHVRPLVVLFVLVLMFLLLKAVLHSGWSVMAVAIHILTKPLLWLFGIKQLSHFDRLERHMNPRREEFGEVQRADRGNYSRGGTHAPSMQGVPSYSIFEHPEYAAHFAIDALDQLRNDVKNGGLDVSLTKSKWAWKHQRIASVAELNSATI